MIEARLIRVKEDQSWRVLSSVKDWQPCVSMLSRVKVEQSEKVLMMVKEHRLLFRVKEEQ